MDRDTTIRKMVLIAGRTATDGSGVLKSGVGEAVNGVSTAGRPDRPDFHRSAVSEPCIPRTIQTIPAGVGEDAFRQRPNPFVGVQLRSVGGEVLDLQAGMSA